jgi:hypothetical protein
MAASYTCDGCGCNVATPKQIGHVLKRDYCEPCADKAQAFLEAEEILRRTTQEQFEKARATFIAHASEGGFKLPDVP